MLNVELESYDEQAQARFETDKERQPNNKIFTTTICTLFKTLSDCPNDADIALTNQAQSPSDYLALKTWQERRQRKRAARPRVNNLLARDTKDLTLNSLEPPLIPSARLSLQSCPCQFTGSKTSG